MEPLIITCTAGRIGPGRGAGHTAAEVADSAYEAWKAGASIVQVRAVSTSAGEGVSGPRTKLDDWVELRDRIREKCDVILHFGVAAMTVDERIKVLELGPDMASFLLGNHDLKHENGGNLYALRTREDNVRLLQAHMKLGVKPEFEIFQSGSAWNLRYVLEQVEAPKPYWCTLFLGWPGGEWSPATPRELESRIRVLPGGAMYTTSVVGDEQTAISALSIHLGGNVRVGHGDYSNYRPGVPGQSNAQFVERIVRLADELSRDVATPGQARRMLGLKTR
jgi:3-keto-5-aminohexanoate cleavage enzyme